MAKEAVSAEENDDGRRPLPLGGMRFEPTPKLTSSVALRGNGFLGRGRGLSKVPEVRPGYDMSHKERNSGCGHPGGTLRDERGAFQASLRVQILFWSWYNRELLEEGTEWLTLLNMLLRASEALLCRHLVKVPSGSASAHVG